jgi:exodeoxyribonuclease VII large subunit
MNRRYYVPGVEPGNAPIGYPSLPPGEKILTVKELTREIKGLMEEAFPSVWVSGEISNLARPSSGHLYLSLKDGDAQIRAVCWRSVALRLRFDIHEGLQVIVHGQVSVYAARGEYQLVIDEIQPKGLGAMELALRQLKEKLFRLGYFAPERKKAIPRFPRRVALVTSPSGAAVRDMLEVFDRRWPALEVWVVPVRVQGDGAAQEIRGALNLVNRLSGADVIIVGRGGGSSEDLSPFNEECVARAIFDSKIPVVSAVGHEIDITVADLVADRRALTPSEAAELVTPHRQELLESLAATESQLKNLLFQRLHRSRDRLQELSGRPVFRRPLERLNDLQRRMDEQAARGKRAIEQWLERNRDRLGNIAARLESLSPLNVLGRGYSLTRREYDLKVVRHPDDVRSGDRLVTLVEHGQIISRVEDKKGGAKENTGT